MCSWPLIAPLRMSPWLKGSIHFVGIGGIGMSGIAALLHEMGIPVQGSDLHATPAWERLKKAGVTLWLGHDPQHVQGSSVVVVSSAISPLNLEVQAAHAQGIPVIGRWQMLAELMNGQWSVGVAGTHGKTTTTSLMGWMWEKALYDPTIINGGIINAYGSNARQGTGPWVIAETDESDGSFAHLPVLFGVVTNIDPEHMEHFQTENHLELAFERFLTNLPFYGAAVVCADHPRVMAVAARVPPTRRLLTYGIHTTLPVYVRATHIRWDDQGMCFNAQWEDGAYWPDMQLRLWGEHNVSNALAVMALARYVGIEEHVQREALSSFEGVKRRLTFMADVQGIGIWDDYAHHPVEILAVLKTLRRRCEKRLIAVCQPHRYSRLKALFPDFVDALSQADGVVVLPVYSAGEAPLEIGAQDLAQELHHKNLSLGTRYCASYDDAISFLNQVVRPGDGVVCLGAGSITQLAQDLPSLITMNAQV